MVGPLSSREFIRSLFARNLADDERGEALSNLRRINIEREMIDEFEKSIIDLDYERSIDACKRLTESRLSTDEILGAIAKLWMLLERYGNKEYFLSERVMAEG